MVVKNGKTVTFVFRPDQTTCHLVACSLIGPEHKSYRLAILNYHGPLLC